VRLPWRKLLPAAAVLLALGVHASRGVAQDGLKHVALHLANEIIPLESTATTVSGLLAELSVSLPGGAFVDPPLDAALKDGMNINLPDMTVTRGECDKTVPAEVRFEECWHYGPEKIEPEEPGQEGLVRTSYTIFFFRGVEVGRRERDEVVRPMLPQKVLCYRTLTDADGPSAEEILARRPKPGSYTDPPLRYRRIIAMESTAYEPGPISCGGDTSGATAIGLKAGYGVVAVDPQVIPLHSRVYVEGYGYAVAGDTGGAIKGNRIDLGFMTLDECYRWGRREVKVYILY